NSASTKVHVDLVHRWLVYRREVLRTPVRTLAAEIGISKSAVDRFYKLRSHPGKNWPRLRDWYMGMRNTEVEEYQTPPELTLASALHTLAEVPSNQRAHALRVTAENFRALFGELKMPMPEWVRMLSDVADREEPS
ncbi:MAG TPA: hypothetical protein VF111_16110, partial [Thermoanaerobaculia bacterium]